MRFSHGRLHGARRYRRGYRAALRPIAMRQQRPLHCNMPRAVLRVNLRILRMADLCNAAMRL
jgi:hypothetical protein